jgi:ABC-type sugar transport system permease subunit
MAAEELLPVEHADPAGTSTPHTILGLLLLAPAALCCIVALAVPTFRTIGMSFQKANLLRSQAEWVGTTNYAALLGDRLFASAFGFTLSIVVVRLLVVAIVPLLLALAVSMFGRWVRIPVRLLFTIPLALFAPAASALAWRLALNPQFGLLRGPSANPGLLADPARVRSTVLLIDGLATFGLACGLGLIFYLAALRGPGAQESGRGRMTKPLVITWITGLLATAALALQSFTLSFVLTGGGPANATMTIALHQYTQAFRTLRFGPAAAVATLVLVIAGLPGLVAGLIIVVNGLRLEIAPVRKLAVLGSGAAGAGGGKAAAAVLLALVLLGSVAICALSIWPLSWSALNSLRDTRAILGGPETPAPGCRRMHTASLRRWCQ